MNDLSIFKLYAFEFVMSLGYLIEVKGGDSSGKSVSRCDPTGSESERGGTRTTRGKRPPVTEIIHFNFYVSLRSLNIAVRKVILYNLERHSLNHS